MQEEQDLGSIAVALGKSQDVEVVVSDVEVVDALVAEAGRDGGGLFLGVGEEDGEFLDGARGDVAAVVAREERLALEVEEEEGRGHVARRSRARWPR